MLSAIGSLNIVIMTGLFTGMVLALQTALSLETFGAKNYVGRVVSLSMVRELGPVLTALMVAGRVGSGIAAELGSMMVTDQINAMRAMGSDPLRKLVVPRLMAALTMLPMLTVLSDTVGLAGGWLISTIILKIPGGLYFQTATDALAMADIIGGLIKPVVFGFIIAMTGCYMGLSTSGGTQGVGRLHNTIRRDLFRHDPFFGFPDDANLFCLPLLIMTDQPASSQVMIELRNVNFSIGDFHILQQYFTQSAHRHFDDDLRRERRRQEHDPQVDPWIDQAGQR